LRAKGANFDDLERRFEESRDAMHKELGDKEKLVRELTSTLQNAQVCVCVCVCVCACVCV